MLPVALGVLLALAALRFWPVALAAVCAWATWWGASMLAAALGEQTASALVYAPALIAFAVLVSVPYEIYERAERLEREREQRYWASVREHEQRRIERDALEWRDARAEAEAAAEAYAKQYPLAQAWKDREWRAQALND